MKVLRRAARWLLALVVALLALLAIEALIAIATVPEDDYRAPSTAPRTLGPKGAPLRLVVLGDSTATGRGAPYERGIAVAAARHLATRRRVTLTNLAVSGARLGDVRRAQLPDAARLRPDVVLLAAGANDVTGLTRPSSVRDHLTTIVRLLRRARSDVAIVVTGSPDVGSAPRLAQPLRMVAGLNTRRLNGALESVVRDERLVLAPLAKRTGQRFRDDRSLFAPDGFHPSAAGYAVWIPVIEAALDQATAQRATPSPACSSATAGAGAGAGAASRTASIAGGAAGSRGGPTVTASACGSKADSGAVRTPESWGCGRARVVRRATRDPRPARPAPRARRRPSAAA